jgi:hypothetical protein
MAVASQWWATPENIQRNAVVYHLNSRIIQAYSVWGGGTPAEPSVAHKPSHLLDVHEGFALTHGLGFIFALRNFLLETVWRHETCGFHNVA